MAKTDYESERKQLLEIDLRSNEKDFVRNIADCGEFLKEFPNNIEVRYKEADYICQLGLQSEGTEKLRLLEEGATKLELLCNEQTVGSFAQKYLHNIQLMIGEYTVELESKFDAYKKISEPVANLWCAYILANQEKFGDSKKYIEDYINGTINNQLDSVDGTKECFAFSEVMVKYEQVKNDTISLNEVLWNDQADYRKNMVLFGLLLKNNYLNDLESDKKDTFMSSLHLVYDSLCAIPEDKINKTVIYDKSILKIVLTTLYREQAREKVDLTEKDDNYSSLLKVDKMDLEALLYCGDNAVEKLDWNTIFNCYFPLYHSLRSSGNNTLNNNLFFEGGRMPWMLYAVLKSNRTWGKPTQDIFYAESKGTSEELVCDLILKLNLIKTENIDLRTVEKREKYFGFDPLNLFTVLSSNNPENKFYSELLKDFVELFNQIPRKVKKGGA